MPNFRRAAGDLRLGRASGGLERWVVRQYPMLATILLQGPSLAHRPVTTRETGQGREAKLELIDVHLRHELEKVHRRVAVQFH